ncbi:MAG: hypothetical protein ACREBH_01565 [Candidatus Micrarchaeaceae archaeon]
MGTTPSRLKTATLALITIPPSWAISYVADPVLRAALGNIGAGTAELTIGFAGTYMLSMLRTSVIKKKPYMEAFRYPVQFACATAAFAAASYAYAAPFMYDSLTRYVPKQMHYIALNRWEIGAANIAMGAWACMFLKNGLMRRHFGDPDKGKHK